MQINLIFNCYNPTDKQILNSTFKEICFPMKNVWKTVFSCASEYNVTYDILYWSRQIENP